MGAAQRCILIVEDEPAIVDILSFNLARAGYAPLTAPDGAAGLAMAVEKNPDLVLLDVMLPRLDGFEVCRRLRAGGFNAPILMLTAREEETDKVLGLELGADDYITKPFSMRELLARVRANIRRTAIADAPAPPGESVLTAGNIALHPGRMEVTKQGRTLLLSQREYDLLHFFMRHPDNVFTREELMEKVWNYEYYGDLRTVDVAVRRLREKIEDNPSDPVLLLTRRGAGYLFAGAPR
ncbi:MAG: response regulator transcription factor [Oscillospiraceae bacterium]|jgi:two-component system response regulator VicR|nr:response regulator transcription factor [Oscillospiraceae bacterium]